MLHIILYHSMLYVCTDVYIMLGLNLGIILYVAVDLHELQQLSISLSQSRAA